jgi:hypothetical protein
MQGKTQALYLLSSGGFLSQEGVSQSDFQVVYLKLPQVY